MCAHHNAVSMRIVMCAIISQCVPVLLGILEILLPNADDLTHRSCVTGLVPHVVSTPGAKSSIMCPPAPVCPVTLGLPYPDVVTSVNQTMIVVPVSPVRTTSAPVLVRQERVLLLPSVKLGTIVPSAPVLRVT
uniref:Uncharacterized protein n=1 Tax=Cacopsylla melanoneura TaxID=428564 RepID=A0A8D8S7F8_9HEMI